MNLIEEIKNRTKIVDLAIEFGLLPTKNDFIFSIYKKEKNRSLKLYRRTNSFFDYSTGQGGDVIKFYADYKKIVNKEAIKSLAKEYDLYNGNGKQIPKTHNNGGNKIETNISKERCIEIYHSLERFCSVVDEKTLQYLTGPKRGLSEETIKRFRLFSIKDVDATIDYLFTSYHLDELKQSGLFNEKGKFVFARHRIIIPYLENESIIYLRGRLLPEFENNGASKYIGLSGQKAKRLFNQNALINLNEGVDLLLCEGEFDTIIAYQAGLKAVGIPGVNNFPDEAQEILKNFDLFLCLDNDEAGEMGVKKIAAHFKRRLQAIMLIKYKDITEVLCNEGKLNLTDPDIAKIILINKKPDWLPKLIDANELANIEIPDTNYIVDNLLPEGANLFVGKPKEGKSVIGMNIALAVAHGGKLFSYFNANKNGVLYLSYEDSLARLKKRINIMKKIDYLETLPANLYFPLEPYDFPVLDENGLKILEGYLENNKDIRLIIIDTLGRGIDPKVYAKGVTYAGEYGYNSLLHRFAHKNHISLLIIHHTRKAPAENDFDEILGTTGIGGAMDNVFILKKVSGNYIFHVRGRDVEEKEYRIKRVEESYSWVIEGENESLKLTEEKKEIVDLLTDSNEVMKSGQIAKALGKKVPNISKHIKALEKEGIVFPHGYGKYAIFPKESKSGKSGKGLQNQMDFEGPEEVEE